MKQITNICIFFMAVIISSNAQVNFQKLTLDGIDSDKPIFVDVYTTWCGPCKKMDRTTFQDSELSGILNENFTCLKWDAEDDRFRALAKGFEINAFPTLLFLDKDQKLISSPVGFLDAEELTSTINKVIQFINENPLNDVDISSLSLEESGELLSKISWWEGAERSELLIHLIGHLGSNDSLWRSHLDLIAVSAPNDLDLEYVEKLVHYNEPMQIYSDRLLTTQVKTEKRISSILDYRLRNAMVAADYKLFEKISHLKGEFALTMRPGGPPSMNTKQFKIDRLDYYGYNKVKDRYLPLADSLVTDYILPHSPEKVLEVDRSQSKYIAEMAKIYMTGEEDEKVDSTSVGFYRGQHPMSLKIANRLNEIANKVLAMFEDKESIKRALEYSTLSYEYVQLPQYLVTRAKIQYKLGDQQGAMETLNEGVNHRFYESMQREIDRLMKKYSGH